MGPVGLCRTLDSETRHRNARRAGREHAVPIDCAAAKDKARFADISRGFLHLVRERYPSDR